MNTKLLMLATASALMLSACSRNKNNEIQTGQVKFNLSVDSVVKASETNPDSRAGLGLSAPELNQFSLRIYGNSGSYDRTWGDATRYSADEVYLPSGEYTAILSYGDKTIEQFDYPCFEGTADFTIDYRPVTVPVVAKMSNVAATVSYTDDLKNYFTEYSAVLKTAAGTEFALAGVDAEHIAFFAAGDIKVTIYYTKQNGKTDFETKTVTGVKPCQYHKIIFDIKQEIGDAEFEIVFDPTLPETTENINLWQLP